MANPQKIITMTKLALYDKHEGASDRAANDYFRHDFIYRKNLGTRLAVGLGCVFILIIYWSWLIFVEGMDIFELNLEEHFQESILFALAALVLYSLIGTIQGTREYYLVQKRLEDYQAHLRHLERAAERSRRGSGSEDEQLERRTRRGRERVRELENIEKERERAERPPKRPERRPPSEFESESEPIARPRRSRPEPKPEPRRTIDDDFEFPSEPPRRPHRYEGAEDGGVDEMPDMRRRRTYHDEDNNEIENPPPRRSRPSTADVSDALVRLDRQRTTNGKDSE
jgi:hypothetical protein